jgi:hypothetical protein
MPFSDPLVAGETILQNVESEGFQPAVQGWRVERDGDAEFNDVTVRGNVTISGAGGTLELNVDILGKPRIKFTTPDGDDYTIFGENAEFEIGDVNRTATIHIVDGFGIALRSLSGGASALFDETDGYLKRGTYSPFTISQWNVVALQNLWTTAGVAAFDDPAFKRDVTGRLWMRGAASGGTKVDGTLLFTLPVGHRPASLKQINVSGDVAGTSPKIQVETDGEVRIYHMGASNAFVLDEVSFSLV